MLSTHKSAKAMYDELTATREPYLTRARECSELTIPSLIPQEGGRGQSLPTPYQSVGAMGVNSISNKLVLTLLPPNTPFFRLQMDDNTRAAMKQAGAIGDVEQVLASYEGTITREIEANADRVAAVEAGRHLVVAGNILVHVPASGTMRVYKLDQYVVKRDRSGNLLRLVIKECISSVALPDEIAEVAKVEATKMNRVDGAVDVYTVVERQSRKVYKTWQEVAGAVVPRSQGMIMADALSYLPLRWSRIDGEDYGRGLVEEYLGDLQSLDGLQKAVNEASAASAKIVYLRNPSSATTADDFASSENGDVLDGLENDFKIVQAQKNADMQAALTTITTLEQRLSKAFLMVSSVQRDAERVTAEEIRLMAGDLEDSLGGVYSTLTLEFQLPYVKRKIALMQMQGKLPHFPKGTVSPTIVTGIAALGRNHEVTKMMSWARACAALVGPEEFARRINSEQLFGILGSAYGVQVGDVVKSEKQLQAEAQAEAQRQMVNTVAPEVIRAGANKSSPQ